MINELHKCITKKFSRCKVYSPYRDNIWGANPAHVKLTLIKLRFLKLIIFVGVNSNHRPPPPAPPFIFPEELIQYQYYTKVTQKQAVTPSLQSHLF